MPGPTKETYAALARAFDHFNRELFDNELPECLITMQRRKNCRGYFHAEQLHRLGEPKQVTHEIALNPATFEGRSTIEILSTLVHEMTHLWQQAHGKPSRTGYHNKQWAAKMIEIGLIPSDTGKPRGKQTGQKVSHYIAPGKPFATAARSLAAIETFPLFQDRADGDDDRAAKKTASKTRYTCPTCETNAWAKPETNLYCGDCQEQMVTEEELLDRRAKLIDLFENEE
jgi:predicted SprT family Zn-dependent metalloprotease